MYPSCVKGLVIKMHLENFLCENIVILWSKNISYVAEVNYGLKG